MQAAAATRTAGLAAYAEPVALLRALRLPVTPSNVSAATLALQRPENLPSALAALERALPRASDDPHIATLRTLLPFVGRIDPRSPALAAQIAAYVEHVVDGAEPKLATLLAAARASIPPEAARPAVPAAPVAPSTPANAAASPSAANTAPTNASASNTPPPAAVQADALPVPAAVAAERAAALGVDLKQTLLALAADRAAPVGLAPSVAGALTALTAMQVGAAQTLAAHPDGIAFTIPLTTAHGFANAQISVKRDAPDGRGAPLDAENFRIAFVLETAHYGTVAIDLVTVGREVTVDVRTEAAPAMRAFRDALGQLTTRLESLRYRVASAGASLGTTTTIAVEAPPSRPADPDASVDRSA
ncbi:MAG: flagellar hook-length control protein FliK [Candidatus Eremiobacteraeota bacterium]|nr:flagellar hook-length control protein FliK [Candidatus Eremiobacteraeota bacterium]MBV9407397.1 flagellar hook-length control protein FliK [Candidatus Eremiobacteraeota bacterium]